MVGRDGVTSIDWRVAAVTVSTPVPEREPVFALIVVCPTARPVTNPLEPAALLTAATALDNELQITDAVISCRVLSAKIPVAVNCCRVPREMLEVKGDTSMETSAADVTVRVVLP